MSKKDLTYVAGLEKAITKKYGELAAANPKANWDEEKEKEYLEQLKELAGKEDTTKDQTEKVENNGFLVSKKLLSKDTNRTCPVCKRYSFELADDLYMAKFECCKVCFLKYVEFEEEKWLSGWRPKTGEN
jgi:DNA repair exonuclease SbcCD ATPase subunit|tara:strand:+ start:77 stop:466 length:390 start_codon:yes stop_codon:yes gene_type:complete